MQINPKWLKSTRFYDICTVLENAGYSAYAVGGCVRDAVLGKTCNDIDISTDATPDDVVSIFSDVKGVTLYPTGIDHGTWTLKWDDDLFEITTFRHDVSTDGRRASVSFSKCMKEDAYRRDFTMNALYMDKSGEVFDPVTTGLYDLLSGVVRFVGDATERCEEDFLRILRLFRFHAVYGSGFLDNSARQAAVTYKEKIIEYVSGERIWSELKKLLGSSFPLQSLKEMQDTGVLSEIVPGSETRKLFMLHDWENRHDVKPCSLRRFYVLAGIDIPFPHSNKERVYLENLKKAHEGAHSDAVNSYLYGKRIAEDVCLLRGLSLNADEILRGQMAQEPVKAKDLMDLGISPGKELGALLTKATDIWIQSDLTADKKTILTGLNIQCSKTKMKTDTPITK